MKLVQGGLRTKEREREAKGVASNCEKKVEMVFGEMMVKSDGREERGRREKEVLAAFLAGLARISANAPHIIPPALLIP